MKNKPFAKWWCAVAAIALLGATAVRSEDAPAPAPPETSGVQATPAEAVQPAKPEAAPAPSEARKPEGKLRRLDEVTVKRERAGRRAHASGDNARVSIGHDSVVPEGESVQAAVSIAGNTTVDGTASDAAVSILGSTTVNGSVADAAVSVFGNTTVNGSAGGDAVAVLGDTRVNGSVRGDVVAVMGNLHLGPHAVVDGQAVVVGGTLHRDPGAVVRGGVQSVSVGVRMPGFGWLRAWAASALLKGRLLSFAGDAAWAWIVAAAFLGLYALTALVFPRAIGKCAETLEQRPGFTILAALLTMLALPLVNLVLVITGIGIIAIPFLGAALIAGKLFGRAAVLAWFGRRIVGTRHDSVLAHPALAVLIGGALVALLYLVPVLALVVFALNGFLGLGMVVYTLILSMRRNGRKPTPAVAAAAPAVAMASLPGGGTAPVAAPSMETPSGAAAENVPASTPGTPPSLPPPVVPAAPAATLPRAGFWIRVAASFLDAILVGLVAAVLHVPGGFPLLFVVYCVVLWALRATTVGGVICGLKIVRLDDRKVDWSVAVVRTLAAFLSLAVVGLGFVWVAFDDARQSWHDKIAGTTIVRVPKGISLI